MTTTYPSHNVVYQCDQHTAHSMKQHKEKVHHAMKNMVNRKVQVHTVHNEVIVGVVVGVDVDFVYLSMDPPENMRGFYPGFYPGFNPPGAYAPFNPILPLALFNLLTISLLL
ncbi:hypothetical protein SAMN05661091_3604 [Paenibacillus uliginis N3/975]|uniref:Uncharacterized protein n=1 Tax=Paenibacillus uliginis N3/975 TaxID=1313296 RepID=A0A1X7HI28_9BACL|nr:hypothetical protein [Paenibacillus uliginis]SMF87051.1 hypothetical protein SAMN05661091_3604 [Paenibacillus uliginis N3/975]